MDCATHKKLLQCNKLRAKIRSVLNGLIPLRTQVMPLLANVSSTLLLWSGFKRSPKRVALFLCAPDVGVLFCL
jgi:hypothetical protein